MNKKSLFSIAIAGLLTLGYTLASAQPGTLDNSFNLTGTEYFNIGSRCQANTSALTAGGHILVGGFSAAASGSHSRYTLINLFPDGTIDTTFAHLGMAIDSFPNSQKDIIKTVLVQPDGKIIAMGSTDTGFTSMTPFISMMRYKANGEPDSTFGNNGKALFHFGGPTVGNSMAIQPDGKYVIAGSLSGKFMAARINANGTVDSSFWYTGFRVISIGNGAYDVAKAIALYPDGRILIAGTSYHSTNYCASLVRMASNGIMDNTFGGVGIITSLIYRRYDVINSLQIQPDGKIIAAGSSLVSSTGSSPDNELFVVRYDTVGNEDVTFGITGILNLNSGPYDDKCSSSLLLPDGKIMVGGYTTNSSYNPNYVLYRINTDGTPDATFGTGGMVTTNFSIFGNNFLDYGACLNRQTDGKIVFSGYSAFSGTSVFTIARYLTDSSLGVVDFSNNNTLLVYPNPIGKELNLSFDLNKDETIKIDLYDITGRLNASIQAEKEMGAGNHHVSLQVPENLPKGEYFVVLQSGQGQRLYVKVLR